MPGLLALGCVAAAGAEEDVMSRADPAPATGGPPLRAAGALLAAGWVVFWCAALNPLAYRLWGSGATPEEVLGIVAAHTAGWRAIALAFAAGSVAMLLGFVLVGKEMGGRAAAWAALGRTALTLGVGLWLASLCFRGTVTVFAAEQLRDAGAVPGWFWPLQRWSAALFAVYMTLAYLALAAYGQALRASGLAARWGLALLAFGLVAAVGFVSGVTAFSPPLMVHPLPGLLGLRLVLRRTDAA